MMEMIDDHLERARQDAFQSRRRRPFFPFLLTVNEVEHLDEHLNRMQQELVSPDQSVKWVQETLRRMGFQERISYVAPALQCTFSKFFDKVETHSDAEDHSVGYTSGGIVFARAADEGSLDCSTILAGGIVTTSESENERQFALAFMTSHRTFSDKDLNRYPFSTSLKREAISGSISLTDVMRVTLDNQSPAANERLQAVMHTTYRGQQVEMADAAAGLLSHFFFGHPSPYFSHFYQPPQAIQ